jgi:hypothetical protein
VSIVYSTSNGFSPNAISMGAINTIFSNLLFSVRNGNDIAGLNDLHNDFPWLRSYPLDEWVLDGSICNNE